MGEIDLRWLAMCAGIKLRAATRVEAILAIEARNKIDLATVRNLDTREVWVRAKFARSFEPRSRAEVEA